jgi:hypothetical protein
MANYVSMSLDFITGNFSLLEASIAIKPLIVYLIGMAIYAIFIFKFYRFVAKRDIFTFKNKKQEKHKTFEKTTGVLSYLIKHIIIFPVLIFFWFAVFAALLAFLSKSQSIESILLISFVVVSTIRVTAYYHEDLSRDLAKMLPFALLAVFIVDITYFTIDHSIEVITSMPSYWKTLVYYMGFAIVLETVLKVVHSAASVFHQRRITSKSEK